MPLEDLKAYFSFFAMLIFSLADLHGWGQLTNIVFMLRIQVLDCDHLTLLNPGEHRCWFSVT